MTPRHGCRIAVRVGLLAVLVAFVASCGSRRSDARPIELMVIPAADLTDLRGSPGSVLGFSTLRLDLKGNTIAPLEGSLQMTRLDASDGTLQFNVDRLMLTTSTGGPPAEEIGVSGVEGRLAFGDQDVSGEVLVEVLGRRVSLAASDSAVYPGPAYTLDERGNPILQGVALTGKLSDVTTITLVLVTARG